MNIYLFATKLFILINFNRPKGPKIVMFISKIARGLHEKSENKHQLPTIQLAKL